MQRSGRIFVLCTLLVAGIGLAGRQPAFAETPAGVAVPGFWDPKRRPERPDVTRLPTQIRFVTTDDYPPFGFRGANGQPTGMNVDLARAICTELAISCTLEVKGFDTLIDALVAGTADAAIAGMAIGQTPRENVEFSDRYFRSPARFVARNGTTLPVVSPETVANRSVAVVVGTTHEAFLRDFFAATDVRAFPTPEAAREALRRSEVDLMFGDGVQLAFWLNGTSSAGCCSFIGGPFLENRYFGEGMGIAVKRGNDALRLALNYALARLWEKGVYTDLYLRWFPISVY